MVPYQPMMPYGQYPMYQQPQPFQPMPQTQAQPKPFSPITGRVVNSLDEITVQEVPTDGTVAWFPSADGSCIYGKRWNPSGKIETFRYLPESGGAEPEADPVAQLNAKVDRALEILGSMVGEEAADAGQR